MWKTFALPMRCGPSHKRLPFVFLFLKKKPSSLDRTSGSDSAVEVQAVEVFPVLLSSRDESPGSSECQLANEEDNLDDTSSFLQLSEKSMRYLHAL